MALILTTEKEACFVETAAEIRNFTHQHVLPTEPEERDQNQ